MHAKSPVESVPNTPDSSTSNTSEHPSAFLNVSPRGPKNCTEDDLKSNHKQRLFDSQEDVLLAKDPSLDEEGFISVKEKKKEKVEGSPRVTRGQKITSFLSSISS